MELKNRIIEIMEKSGLTPSEFADKIEVQRSAISHITSGRNKPSLEFLIKIKHSFPEIDTDWLIFGTEKEEISTEISPENENMKKNNSSYPTLFELFDSDIKTEKNSTHSETQLQENTTGNSGNKKMLRALLFFSDGSFEEFVRAE
ncbi:MAG TPA: helix-turn-helix domain-containing protein [Moheibacter sp.]|nr:helix-turn-helix domain-containing protein [Moheibacter sp.]